jgi:hypothetical protein
LAQVIPQPPQLFVSLLVSMQVVRPLPMGHMALGVLHSSMLGTSHWPLTHDEPWHLIPQPPQLFGS